MDIDWPLLILFLGFAILVTVFLRCMRIVVRRVCGPRIVKRPFWQGSRHIQRAWLRDSGGGKQARLCGPLRAGRKSAITMDDFPV
jgi:hypothetical protein